MTRCLLGAAALLLALAPAAHAQYWACSYAAPVVVSSYPVAIPVAVPIYEPLPIFSCNPVPACVAPAPVIVPPYAPPTAAPPSDEPAPLPPSQPVPTTPPAEASGTTRMTSAKLTVPSFCDVYPVAAKAGRSPSGDRRTVSFWNLSGRDVILTVAGQTWTVPRGGRARLDLERRFTWQLAGRESRHEDVPATSDGLEIVIRR
jgi:hypothetical protein